MFEFKILNNDTDGFSVENQFAYAVLEGLSKKNKCLPSWLIFDSKGSEIFKEISRFSPDAIAKHLGFEIIKTEAIEFKPNPFNQDYLISKAQTGHVLYEARTKLQKYELDL